MPFEDRHYFKSIYLAYPSHDTHAVQHWSPPGAACLRGRAQLER
jgi:hypothetical protein